ncbi:ImmA/IrrE family metallo-endopeptidase [Brevibacterium casei]|uniref:IrrE N-terminal-like domain-containing protein n=2 Tax=Brevibacterium casei TaxID=33889 RepID=A0A2H1K4G4_9MICO|nr:ImmA/IrrE family metallo-endopeptidase [Brevibacterium casei]MCT1548982.1 ImmA/IrrE family metallo-endopeptidase [Brevibacterium casei]MCT1558951.1 ImmA/IrrE family metallo-endopeptidase [Brevibacterium casei]MCT2207192.1 ImmA/IrrE family metallo-endopeptidase [Brevibacterium casei]QPR38056.1 ImmA/IrrE family metallo-endopeptidase [Brevibacterium casei]QPR45345.1 ImmA/IrrE family metallo-endopeptidase [Brevibacterium casei]
MASIAQRRNALQAADDLLNDLEIDQAEAVDVFDIVDRLGLWLVFNRLDNLLGASVPKGNGGIMLTTQRGPAVQRYTAAHEIGHWVLDINEPAFDSEEDIFYPTGDREQLAQLFAGQLLMPPPLVFAACARHGVTDDVSATAPAVYLVARDMGASYEAASRQLSNLDIISTATRDDLLRRKPVQAKTELCHGHRPRGAVDVWPVGLTAGGTQVRVTEGDELVITLPENRTTAYRWMTEHEISARSLHVSSPEPGPFTDVVRASGEGPEGVTRRPVHRSTASIDRALARIPGNSDRRRILPRFESQGDDTSQHSDQDATGLPDESRSALEPVSARLVCVEDHFTAGWARIAPSEIRSVRRAIAGRQNVALPESVQTELDSEHIGQPAGLEPSMIPAAATGERLLALQASGVGSLELDLTYTSAVDPHAQAAATFNLSVEVTEPPQVRRRRLLLEQALIEEDDHSDLGGGEWT